jgi:hypothetical protein
VHRLRRSGSQAQPRPPTQESLRQVSPWSGGIEGVLLDKRIQPVAWRRGASDGTGAPTREVPKKRRDNGYVPGQIFLLSITVSVSTLKHKHKRFPLEGFIALT